MSLKHEPVVVHPHLVIQACWDVLIDLRVLQLLHKTFLHRTLELAHNLLLLLLVGERNLEGLLVHLLVHQNVGVGRCHVRRRPVLLAVLTFLSAKAFRSQLPDVEVFNLRVIKSNPLVRLVIDDGIIVPVKSSSFVHHDALELVIVELLWLLGKLQQSLASVCLEVQLVREL